MKLHHIGRVVENLDRAVQYYRDCFGLEPAGDPVVDPIQKVEVVILNTGYGSGATIELICPVAEDSPVASFLKQGGGLHHLCFEVPDIHRSLRHLKQKGAKVLGEVVPGKGHGGRPTVWIYTAEKELVELVEIS